MRYARIIFKKRLLLLAVILLIATFCVAQRNQRPPVKPYKELSESEALEQLAKMAEKFKDTAASTKNSGIYYDLEGAAQWAIKHESKAVADAIGAFPSNSTDLCMAKAHALAFFKEPVDNAVPFLVACLDNPDIDVQKQASEVLVAWDREWDKAIACIKRNNNYLKLGASKNPHVVEVLRYGVDKGSFEGRVLAASALRGHGDSTTIIMVSKYIIVNAPVDDDDQSLARAKYTALETLAKHHELNDIPSLRRLADDQSTLVRMQSVDALALAASTGNEAARQALQDIAVSSADSKLRSTVQDYLQKLEETHEERK